MTKHLAAALAVAVLALAGVGAAQPAPAAAATCDGVWVVVDYGSLGGTSTACATEYGTGVAALRSAGFTPSLDNGMLSKINGLPGQVDLNKNYWSYWQAGQKADGSHAAWTYSKLGATASHPVKGNAEGWHYVGLSDSATGPSVSAPDSPVTKPSPTPSATSKAPKPTPAPTKSPTRTPAPSASPSATRSAGTSATATPSAPGASPTPSASAGPSGPTAMATPPVAQAPVPTGTPGGSPVGLIASAVVVVAGGGGLGLWWYLRGRKR